MATKPADKKIYLASKSPRRRELLRQIGIDFELLLLRETGFLPTLDVQTLTLGPLAADGRYALVPEAGVREAGEDAASLAGSDWQALQRALDDTAPFTALLRRVAELSPGTNAALRLQLRALLNYHCGVNTLRTRQMMRELQNL